MKKFSNIFLGIIISLSFLVRIWNLNQTPPALYWDEMDVGYQAYSILKTGKDYFGENPGFVVHSFADHRAPGFIYAIFPFVALLGLNAFSVRLPSAISGVVLVFLVYLLGKLLFKSEKTALIAAALTGFSPWSILYSRMAFETTLLLTLFLGGTVCFIRGLKNSKWWILSGVLFGLTLITYNTAKLFVPLIFLTLILIYVKKENLNNNFRIGSAILGIVLILSLYANIFQGGGQRFSEISILTDPQIAAKIDYFRNESALSFTDSREAGLNARLIDKILYNKVSLALDRITQNYLSSFSPQFLFISGDPNLRHSVQRAGEFYRIEFVSILLGLGFLFLNIKRGEKAGIFLAIWIILAAIPASITRDGGMHASRLAFLFPALSIVSALGLNFIWSSFSRKISPVLVSIYAIFWVFGVIFFLNYYFGAYKFESAKYFQYGFSEAVEKASKQTDNYDYVIIDDRKDSALMNYLFGTSYDPFKFQSQIKDLPFELSGIKGSKLGNLVFFDPDTRDWATIFSKNKINKNFLLVVSAEQFEEQTIEKVPQKLTENQKLLDIIYYQNGDVAFYVIESKKSLNQ